jgi:hypothetical protein
VAELLYGAVPFGVISAVFGIALAKDRARAFKLAAVSFVLAGVTFLLSVIIGSVGAIPT